jgi:hypothetical protein
VGIVPPPSKRFTVRLAKSCSRASLGVRVLMLSMRFYLAITDSCLQHSDWYGAIRRLPVLTWAIPKPFVNSHTTAMGLSSYCFEQDCLGIASSATRTGTDCVRLARGTDQQASECRANFGRSRCAKRHLMAYARHDQR